MGFMSMLNQAKGQEVPLPKPKPAYNPSQNKPAVKAPPRPTNSKPVVPTPRVTPTATKPRNRPPPPTLNRSKSNPISAMKNKNKLAAKQKPVTTVPKPARANPPRQPYNSSKPSKYEAPKPAEPRQKLSFKEMMKKASQIDKSKLELNLKTRDPKSHPPKPVRQRIRKPALPTETEAGIQVQENNNNPAASDSKRQPAPFAQPLPSVLAKYQKLRGHQPSEDEDLDGFIENSDGEESRPDIWSMFNRRPRYEYDEDSESDMEATGGDILDEERRSAAQARREDIAEERKLEELARRKRLRK